MHLRISKRVGRNVLVLKQRCDHSSHILVGGLDATQVLPEQSRREVGIDVLFSNLHCQSWQSRILFREVI